MYGGHEETKDKVTDKKEYDNKVHDKKVTDTAFGVVLRQGMANDDVRRLQKALNDKSAKYDLNYPVLVEDGQFGSQTAAVVRIFQREKGIDADGIAGPITLQKLGGFYTNQ